MTRSIGDIFNECKHHLAHAGIYAPESDAAEIVAHVSGIDRESILQKHADFLSDQQVDAVKGMLIRRMAREPLARIFGSIPFGGVTLMMRNGVFEPMEESEALVEHAVILLEKEEGPLRILDIATGSGALLLAALKALPNATGLGVDVDETALDLARANAEANSLSERAIFQQHDLGEGIAETFDLVLANPPFVPHGLIKHLMPEMRVHNPAATLDGGKDGMKHYRRLARQLPGLLKEGASCICQSSIHMTATMTRVFRQEGFTEINTLRNGYGVPGGLQIVNQNRKNNWLTAFIRPFRLL